jgi:hypothetical protein
MRWRKIMLIKNLLFFVIIQSLFVKIALADNLMPTYNNGTLTLPSVSTTEKVGLFQDVIFKLTTDGLWQLTDGKVGDELQPIEAVEIIKADTFPVQVFLKVSGTLPVTCGINIGQIQHRLVDNKFEVFIYHPNIVHQSCFSATFDYSVIIPLPIYSLKKGEYSYSLNNTFVGKFNLDKDNEIDPNTL